MSDYLFLVPISLALALIGLGAFLWSLRHEQYDDLDGAAERVLFADDRPIVEKACATGTDEERRERADPSDPGNRLDL